MTKDPDSAECPVCGRSVPPDAASCPGCGADLSMSSLEELEKVAKSLSTGEPMPTKEEVRKEEAKPVRPSEPVVAKTGKRAEPEPPKQKAEEGAKEGRFGKLFGKRKK